LGDQGAQGRDTTGLAQFEGNAQFARIQEIEEPGIAAPGAVGSVDTLGFDDPGAARPQELGAQGTRPE
jgi:hypothetical protein